MQKLQRALTDAFVSIDGASSFFSDENVTRECTCYWSLIDYLDWPEI